MLLRLILAATIVVLPPDYVLTTTASNNTNDASVAGHRVLKIHAEEGRKVVTAMFQDRQNRYWISTMFELYSFDEKQDLWTIASDGLSRQSKFQIKYIGQSKDGILWFIPDIQSLSAKALYFDGKLWGKIDQDYKHDKLANAISAMFQGRDGRLWFATGRELIAYDGKQWTRCFDLSMLNDERTERQHIKGQITAGFQDSSGYLWLGVIGRGILRFDEHKQNANLHNPLKRSELSTGDSRDTLREAAATHIKCIYEDRRGRIWFGSANGYVYSYQKNIDSWHSYNLVDNIPPKAKAQLPTGLGGDKRLGISAIYQDKGERLMFATERGLLTFHESKNTWGLFTPENSSLPGDHVTSIMEDRSERIWIATGAGIVVLEP